jgi:hypothetical protein
MMFPRLIVLSLAALSAFSVVQADDAIAPQIASCPPVKQVDNKGYHAEASCDRAHYNAYKDSLRRDYTYDSLKQEGGAMRVPSAKTVTCPLTPVNLHQQNARQGYDTTWIVDNTASTPVVLAYLLNGVEYSAVNSKITPPQADPEAILKPGEWKAVSTFEVRIFSILLYIYSVFYLYSLLRAPVSNPLYLLPLFTTGTCLSRP